MTSRLGFVSGVLLAVAFSISFAADGFAQAQKGLKNNTGEGWISRRHKDDWNKSEDIAVVLSIKKKAGQENDNVVTGTIWLYDDLNTAGDKYKKRVKYDNLAGVISHVGGPKRGRETCELTLPGTNGIKVWVTLYKNKINNSGNAPRVHQRVVLRYKEGSYAAAGGPDKKSANGGCDQGQAAAATSDDGCEEEPNEDVLEEEEISLDPMTMDPLLAYDP
jgi:hypothetical protein